jgi:seryl-tRNA synthetase
MHYEVRHLDHPLGAHEIKRCAYLFHKRHGDVDLHINEVDGRTVSLRADDPHLLERAWQDLLDAAASCGSEPATEHGPGAVRVLFERLGRHFWSADRLLAQDHVQRLPAGQVVLTGPLARLRQRLPRLLDDLGRREGAVPFFAEPHWHDEDLEHHGYHPHSQGLVTVAASGGDRFWQIAACNQVWRSLEGCVLERPVVYETSGTCCRDEGHNHYLLERLFTFTMREVTFAGLPAEARAFRDRCVAWAEVLVKELELDAVLAPAGDPFFLAGAREDEVKVDLPRDCKVELRLRIREDATLACASFNVHGSFFADRLGYRHRSHRTPWTACTAFGVERWVWAVLCQHGADPAGWPRTLRKLVEDGS